MGSGGRRTAERRVKIKNRVRKQLAPWMSVKVMFYILKESQILWLKRVQRQKNNRRGLENILCLK